LKKYRYKPRTIANSKKYILPEKILFTATMDEIKIAQKSLRCFVYSTFTKYPFLSANICMTSSTTITTNTRDCAFINEKLSIYSILLEKLIAYWAERSVFKHEFFRLCKFHVDNITLVLFYLQQFIGTTKYSGGDKYGKISLTRRAHQSSLVRYVVGVSILLISQNATPVYWRAERTTATPALARHSNSFALAHSDTLCRPKRVFQPISFGF
jgi:hypothetical protein